MSREALVLLVCCCDFRDGAERLIPSKSLRNAVIWAFPGLLCILRMCAPRRAAAVVWPRGREKSADRRRRILISRLLIIRTSVPRRKSPFPAYFRGFPAVSPLIPPYPAFLKYPVSPQFVAVKSRIDAWTLLRVLVVPCLFLCAIFKRPIFQWIACAALFVWVCFVISKLFRSHRKHCKKMPAEQKAFPAKQETKPLTETPQEADDDTRLSLLRQVNYRIMEQLKQSYPTVAWLWEARPSSEEISKGCTKRIKLYHCDPFNFGEVTLSATGKLEIALVQMVPLAEAELQPHNDEDLEEQDILDRSDVKQWYTQKGIALLSALIDELNVQGHKRLTIKENGDVFVTASGKQQPVDTIPDFPPRPAWEDLCVLAREDDIAAEVCNQELTVSWA